MFSSSIAVQAAPFPIALWFRTFAASALSHRRARSFLSRAALARRRWACPSSSLPPRRGHHTKLDGHGTPPRGHDAKRGSSSRWPCAAPGLSAYSAVKRECVIMRRRMPQRHARARVVATADSMGGGRAACRIPPPTLPWSVTFSRGIHGSSASALLSGQGKMLITQPSSNPKASSLAAPSVRTSMMTSGPPQWRPASRFVVISLIRSIISSLDLYTFGF
jgi:hypothetical protein